MTYLVKYLELLGRYAPTDESADIFGFRGVRLGGQLFDETNIGTKTEITALQSALTALTSSFNGHAFQQVVDLNVLRTDIAALYGIAQAISRDIQTLNLDGPDEEEILAMAGQTLFVSTYLKWSPNVDLPDIEVYRNGIHMTQDLVGGTDRDFRKVSQTSIEFVRPAQADDRITIRTARAISNSISWPAYYQFSSGHSGRAIPTPARFRVGLNVLSVFRNGVLLINSSSVGTSAGRYDESSMTYITLGISAITTELIAFVNRAVSPDYRFVQSGVSGATLTVPSFVVGSKRLLVWRNGVLMNNAGFGSLIDQYTESTVTSLSLASASAPNEVFVIEHRASAPLFNVSTNTALGLMITLPGTIVAGDQKLLVFRNGVLMVNSATAGTPIDRYLEASSTTISLASPATSADVFTFIYG